MAGRVKLATILRAGSATLAGTGTVGIPTVNQPPVQDRLIPNFSLPRGGRRLLSPYFSDPEGDPIFFRKGAVPASPTDITVDENGNLVISPTCPLGVYQTLLDYGAVPFAGILSTQVAEIPEIWFIVGFAEVEEMGIYICDPFNRTQPGDLWWQTGARLQRHELQGGGDWLPLDTVAFTVTGTVPSGITFDPATARILWNGGSTANPALEDCTVELAVGTKTRSFRLRVLKPTVICTADAASLPASLAGIRVVAPSSTAWASLKTDATTAGNSDTNPRVILFADAFTPRNDWFIGDATTNNDFRYMYICGVPINLSQLGNPWDYADLVPPAVSRDQELFSIARMRGFHFKNLKLGNCGAVLQVQESGFPTRWTLQKIDCLRRNPDSGVSNFENGNDWEPNTYPSQANDFKLFVSNIKMLQGGYIGGTKHGFYVETNGYTFGHWNNCYFAGGNKCSIVKSTLGYNTVRNCVGAACATPLSPYDELFWAQEVFNFHAHTDVILYNNIVWSGRDPNWGNGAPHNFGHTINMGTGMQNGALCFTQDRRAILGSNTPIYPAVSWDPPLAPGGSTTGPASPHLGSFSPGAATYASQAFWDTVFANGLDNAANAMLYKHFYSFNWVRHMTLTPNKTKILRADGTSPQEEKDQFAADTFVLGVPDGWVERQLIWMANNSYDNWATTEFLYDIKNSGNIVVIEDGTKFASWYVTLNSTYGGAAGYIRVRISNGDVRDASTALKNAVGWTQASPPAPFDTWTEWQAIADVSIPPVEGPRWPPAKWPAGALGPGPHASRVDPYIPRVRHIPVPSGATGFEGGHAFSDRVRSATNPELTLPDWFKI